MAPNMATPARKPKMLPTAKIGFWKRRSGMIGSTARCSTTTKTTASTMAAASRASGPGATQP